MRRRSGTSPEGPGVVALLLLTAVLVLGIAATVRWQRPGWPRFLVADLHKHLTLLSIVFVAAHVVTTVADGFAPIRLLDAVVPFASPYRPIWLGLGAVAFDLLLALLVTSLVRARIGYGSWRVIHFLAYAAWPVALVHAFGTGSDGRMGWFALLGFGCAWRPSVSRWPFECSAATAPPESACLRVPQPSPSR